MRLLLFTDYALRILLYVATHPRAPVPASTIAAAYGISADHVAKATKTLTRKGFLPVTGPMTRRGSRESTACAVVPA